MLLPLPQQLQRVVPARPRLHCSRQAGRGCGCLGDALLGLRRGIRCSGHAEVGGGPCPASSSRTGKQAVRQPAAASAQRRPAPPPPPPPPHLRSGTAAAWLTPLSGTLGRHPPPGPANRSSRGRGGARRKRPSRPGHAARLGAPPNDCKSSAGARHGRPRPMRQCAARAAGYPATDLEAAGREGPRVAAAASGAAGCSIGLLAVVGGALAVHVGALALALPPPQVTA